MAALLEADRACREFRMGGVIGGTRIQAVRAVSFTLGERAEIYSIIGESGSGKTTLARMILGILPVTAGAIRFQGRDLATLHRGADRLALMARVQPIFQNPFESFNPMKRVERYLRSTASRFGSRGAAAAEIDARIDGALGQVGLSLDEVRGRFPHELSGGQLQRVAVARALIPGPALIVADEPVSMVDASLRMAIVNLFRRLCDESGVTIIYITHDLATAYYISDRIAIMHEGRFVETGPARQVLDAPRDPYTIKLKAAVLSPDAAGGAGLRVAAHG